MRKRRGTRGTAKGKSPLVGPEVVSIDVEKTETLCKCRETVLHELEKIGVSLSDEQKKALGDKMIFGFADWAARKMGDAFQQFAEEATKNFLVDLFQRSKWDKNPRPFDEAFDLSAFFVPQKVARQAVHRWDVVTLWNVYRLALRSISTEAIPREIEQRKGDYLQELKTALVAMDSARLKKLVANSAERSDIALEFTLYWARAKKLSVPVGREALKKYFKDFGSWEAFHSMLNKSLSRD